MNCIILYILSIFIIDAGHNPRTLQIIELPYMNNTRCGEMWDEFDVAIDETMICAFRVGHFDACQVGVSIVTQYFANIQFNYIF